MASSSVTVNIGEYMPRGIPKSGKRKKRQPKETLTSFPDKARAMVFGFVAEFLNSGKLEDIEVTLSENGPHGLQLRSADGKVLSLSIYSTE